MSDPSAHTRVTGSPPQAQDQFLPGLDVVADDQEATATLARERIVQPPCDGPP